MDIRHITPQYAVSPQIAAEDVPALVEAGFTTVICNRPDPEIPPTHYAEVIEAAAKAAGVDFHVLALTHETMTPENVARQRKLIEDAEGPVLAYCASGTRCSVVWALGQAGTLSADDILAATRAAGYNLDGLRPALEASAPQG
ncbi:TIGR01244 family sulfur transferase [Thalassococcus sp. S3]|uniref:TIGR01244 family sulfur transferase n=1 Tax=Thalassococcus sp. S3 TaxID=2017482 RepID=UPI0010248D74|nr:TIGR01244 family sulfur transferase [Thalassococcus sp. S3]QBF32560.1 TIGR01244 family protein [Thalassococcus sp. S3]